MNGLLGVQEPTFEVVPTVADYQTADEAIELATAAGIELLPWEAEQVRRILGQTPDQEWTASRCGLCVPRQNGKGVVLETVVLAKTVLLREKVLWTAHEVRTMQESFARFRAILDGTPALSALVSTVRTANGQESVTFTNGARVKFSARSKSATRGLGFRTIICDEGQELDYLTMGAMLPTLSGQGQERTQLIVTGTPPYSKKGEVFADMRASAYVGGDDRLAWSEWAAEPSDRSDDRAVWARTNPSLGVVIMEDKIVDEWDALKARPDVFRRERLGEWGKSGDRALALPVEQWSEGRRPQTDWPARDDKYTFSDSDVRVLAVDCTFDAQMTTLVELHPLEGQRVGVTVVEAAPGLSWVAEAAGRIREDSPRVVVVFDPLRTGDLTPDLQNAGIRSSERRTRIVAATGRDLTLACDALVRQVREGRLLHNDPRLDAAADGATRSTFDDGKGWKLVGVDGADVSPLIATALGLRVLLTQAPTRRGKGSGARIL